MADKEKQCFKCGEVKSLSEFYKNKGMLDGHLNKCKECAKKYSRGHRASRIDYYREYDRARGNRQEKGYLEEYRNKFPNKYRATNMVNNAIRDGKLFREACEVCGTTERLHAHHDDYAKPLNVRWLCAAHHRQWHMKHGEAKNP